MKAHAAPLNFSSRGTHARMSSLDMEYKMCVEKAPVLSRSSFSFEWRFIFYPIGVLVLIISVWISKGIL